MFFHELAVKSRPNQLLFITTFTGPIIFTTSQKEETGAPTIPNAHKPVRPVQTKTQTRRLKNLCASICYRSPVAHVPPRTANTALQDKTLVPSRVFLSPHFFLLYMLRTILPLVFLLDKVPFIQSFIPIQPIQSFVRFNQITNQMQIKSIQMLRINSFSLSLKFY